MSKSLRVSHDCINKVKLAVNTNGYPSQKALAYDTGLALATVNNFLTGKPVAYTTFEELCRKLNLNWREIAIINKEVTSTPPQYVQIRKKKQQFQDWGTAVDISVFHGRREELTQLESCIIQDSCRLVAIVGMGGVGKTTLVTQLAQQIQDQFDYVFWRSVPTIPNFNDIITDMIRFFSHHKESKPDINRLIHYLRNRRCLIILDNLDIALDAGDTEYNNLLRIIAETKHESCIIFTSRVKPPQVKLLEKWSLSVRCLRLLGSPEIAFSLVQSQQLLGTEKQKYQLCDLYSNNPLKIKIVAHTIIDLFNGDIETFLAHKTLLVSQQINTLLEQQLKSISTLEQQIIYNFATHHQPVTINSLINKLPHISKSHIFQSIENISSRCLIEKTADKYILQPLIIEYVQNNFHQNIDPFMNF